MVVSKTTYSHWLTWEGTIAEVMAAINAHNVPLNQVRFVYDNANSKLLAIQKIA